MADLVARSHTILEMMAVFGKGSDRLPAVFRSHGASEEHGYDICIFLSSIYGHRKSHLIKNFNVCFSHGNKEVFSCRGIKLAVDWFLERGHKDVTVFVPAWRKEQSRPDALITGKLHLCLFSALPSRSATAQMNKPLAMKGCNRKYLWCSNFLVIYRQKKDKAMPSPSPPVLFCSSAQVSITLLLLNNVIAFF